MDRRYFLKAAGLTTGGLVVGVGMAEPSLAVGAPTSAVARLEGMVGVTDHDLNPRGSVLVAPGDGALLIDQDYRSVGLNFGRIVTVNAVQLASDRTAHRLNSRDVAVYTSADNKSWTRRRSEFLDLGTTIWLYGFDVRARYVKVHCYRDGASADATFGNADPQQLVSAFVVPAGAFVAGGGGRWSHRIPISITNPGGQTLLDRAAYISHQDLGTSALVDGGILRADFADLRFADDKGHQLHAYDDGDGIFVRIPSLHGRQAIVIYAYTGNPEAESVLADAGALQVEYGHRTYQSQAGKSAAGLVLQGEVHPLSLPDGTLLMTGATTAAGGIHARYSRDGGRTWSIPEPLIPPSDPSLGTDRPGGYLTDPVTGTVTAVLYSLGVNTGGPDWTDPTQHLSQIWIARATTYDAQGRPIFEAPQHLPIRNFLTGKPVAYANTYTNPIRTRSGAYVFAVPHAYLPLGPGALTMFRSVDEGRTWTQSAESLLSPDEGAFEGGPSETSVAQLPSGQLMIIVRHQTLKRYYFATSHSDDDGVTWSPLTDSRILASNTTPCFLDRESGLLLSWSGHNGFGQTSYYRNNFTIAYSTDGRQFEKYHDITGATSISTPGWGTPNEQIQMQEPFIVPAGSNDLLVGWENGGSASLPGASMLVEDIDDYLHKSHGALDVIRYLDSAGIAGGKELSQSRWWRTATPGTVTIAGGIKPGRTAVRLTTAAGEKKTGISRLFPGSRQARVRFWLRWDTIGSQGVNIALQEAYGKTGNDHGAIALFRLGPDGTLGVASDDIYDAIPKGGYCEADTNPAVGKLSWSGGPVALDYNHRSAGLYLGAQRDVSSLVLTGAAQYATGGTSTRLEPSDLEVWISNNNIDWTQVTGWNGTKDGLTITLTGPTFNSSFVKVHQPYGDKAFTFANVTPPLVAALPNLEQAQTFRPLQVPTQLDPQDWHRVEIDVNLDNNRITTAIDGQTVSRLGSVHPAETMTHLLVEANGGGGSDLRIAELIVQDTTHGLPELGQVSTPTSVGRRG